MIKLNVTLTNKAEECFRELLDTTKCDEKDIVLDALALLHLAVENRVKGKKIALFDSETKEATIVTLPTLIALG